ncbi:MAG: hypothetical protein HOZ81_42510 [Streptomyces sp.]|nr:hypothetical protein [Streptomyces sp.]
MIMAGDGLLDGGDADQETDVERARIAHQYTLGEGPAWRPPDRAPPPVFATNLTRPPASRHWPLFAVQAAKTGAEAAFSPPLTGAGNALGTLDLYRTNAGSLSGDGIRTALLVADVGHHLPCPAGH